MFKRGLEAVVVVEEEEEDEEDAVCSLLRGIPVPEGKINFVKCMWCMLM